MKKCITILLVALHLLVAGIALAGDYPNKPIRFVVPFPAGGYSDVLARIISQPLSVKLGQPIVIDNRPGASGNIGAELVARAPADGYTFLILSPNFVTNPSLLKTLPFDPVKDFTHISRISESPLLVVAHPSIKATSMKELIELLRARPGEINYGSAGVGTSPHLIGELIKISTGTNMVHVPYKGSGGVMTAILSGEIHLGFPYLPPAMPHVTSGRLRALAVTSQRRATTMPQVPTIAEAAIPGFDVTGWLGLSGPPNMSKEIIGLFEREIAKIVQDPAIKAQLVAQGAEPAGSTSQVFTEFVPAEIAKWAKVVKVAGLKVK